MKRVLHKGRRHTGTRVAGLVLAGGRGTRSGGRDKGLLKDRGRVMVARAREVLAPVSDLIVISANRNVGRYLRWGDVVTTDAAPQSPGPLAGIAAALSCVRPRILLTCPCDAADVPADVPVRLLRALRLTSGADAAVLRDRERLQPLLLALRGALLESVDAYLQGGGRSVHGWLATLNVVEVRCRRAIGNRNAPLAMGQRVPAELV